MSWHQLAMCRPPPASPSPQNLLKSMRITKSSIQIHGLASIGNVQAFPQPPYFSKPVGTSQMPCMMETSMQKKTSAAKAEPLNPAAGRGTTHQAASRSPRSGAEAENGGTCTQGLCSCNQITGCRLCPRTHGMGSRVDSKRRQQTH